MIVLGIETSCDETAVAVVDDARRILANRVLSQDAEHRPYGGVVPEIAARSHLAHLPGLMDLALEDAGLDLGRIDAIAATAGPGLIGGVFVGVLFAKALAAARSLPFIAVNHLEAHALTARLSDDVRFPYLLLLVSGGHSELIAVEGVGRYRPYGATIDDAVGEAFDKTAKLLGLSYPGGPQIERLAKAGDASRFALPRPMLGRKELDFSFAGLKTAVRRHSDGLDDQGRADLAASFQAAVADILADRVARALIRFQAETKQAGPLVVAGGVASNLALRERLASVAEAAGTRLVAPPPKLCTDNAAMIAWVGVERRLLGESDRLDFAARPRWPLAEMTAA